MAVKSQRQDLRADNDEVAGRDEVASGRLKYQPVGGIRPDLQRNPISHRSDFGPLHGTRYTGLTGRSGSIFKTKKCEFKFC